LAGQVVFAAARRASAPKEPAATHPGIHPVPLDVTAQASIDHARQQIQTQTGGYGLDVLGSAAGILVLDPVEAVSDQQTRVQLEVNLFGAVAVTRASSAPPAAPGPDGATPTQPPRRSSHQEGADAKGAGP
jgi:NAD(P)-dependent dehydrogenase (short-subunit alcohol dehydrogenase family)